jgi:hypothetical protein
MKFVVFFALIAAAFAQQCAIADFRSICQSVTRANHTVDNVFNSYLPTIEAVYAQYLPTWRSALETIASRHNIEFCDDCWTALTHMLCSATAPSCGFLQCFSAAAQQINLCAQGCQDDCAGGALSGTCGQCLQLCYNEALFDTCKPYMIGRQMCADFVRVCGCVTNAATVADICSYFDPAGYNIPLPAGLSCTGRTNWCANVNRQSGSRPGVVCSNNYMCFTIPQSNGQTSVASPVVADDTASANGIVASLVLVIAAMLF